MVKLKTEKMKEELMTMTIYVDADACPVTRIVEKIAKEYRIPIVLLCDTTHVLTSDHSAIKCHRCRSRRSRLCSYQYVCGGRYCRHAGLRCRGNGVRKRREGYPSKRQAVHRRKYRRTACRKAHRKSRKSKEQEPSQRATQKNTR